MPTAWAAEAIDLSYSFNPVVAIPFGTLSSSEAGKQPLKQAIASLRFRRAKVLIHKVVSERAAAALRAMGADMITMRAI